MRALAISAAALVALPFSAQAADHAWPVVRVIDGLTLLPDPGPRGKLTTDLEGRDDKADEAAIFAGIQGTVGCPAVGVYRTRFLGHKFVSCGGPE